MGGLTLNFWFFITTEELSSLNLMNCTCYMDVSMFAFDTVYVEYRLLHYRWTLFTTLTMRHKVYSRILPLLIQTTSVGLPLLLPDSLSNHKSLHGHCLFILWQKFLKNLQEGVVFMQAMISPLPPTSLSFAMFVQHHLINLFQPMLEQAEY